MSPDGCETNGSRAHAGTDVVIVVVDVGGAVWVAALPLQLPHFDGKIKLMLKLHRRSCKPAHFMKPPLSFMVAQN